MPWSYNDAEINNLIDANLKDSPPNPPMSNTASTVRALLKAMWVGIRTQVSAAVTAADNVSAGLIQRSLAISSNVYVSDTGNDANTGATSDSAVRTFNRVVQLHSNKTTNLVVVITGTVTIDADITLRALNILFFFSPNAKLLFKKNATNNGNYALHLDCNTAQFTSHSTPNGGIETEGHGGNVLSESTDTYMSRQGCIRLRKDIRDHHRVAARIQSIGISSINVVAGDNSIVFAGTEVGAQPSELNYCLSSSFFSHSNITPTLGSSAKLEANFHGRKVFPRSYTPTSSTDANVIDGEMTMDASFLYVKRSGTIKKIALTAF